MAAMNFPSSPADGATFVSDGGVTYIYNSAAGKWKTLLITADDALPLSGGAITGNLSVSGAVGLASGAATAPTLQFTANTGIYSPGADQVAISTGGTGRLFVDANGNVGVGAASPAGVNGKALTVYASDYPRLRLINDATGTASGDGAALFMNSDDLYVSNEESGGQILFRTAAAERLRIDSSGRVGIGTSSPQLQLSLNHVTQPKFGLFVNDTEQYRFQAVSGGNYIDLLNADLIIRGGASGTTNIAAITNAGNVGVGTTSPNRQLQVAGATAITNSGDTGAFLFDPAGSVNTLLSRAGQSSTTAVDLAIKMGNTERLRIDSNGRVGIGTSTVDSLLHLVKSDATTYNATAADGQVGVGPTIYLENPANLNTTVGGQIVFGMRSTEEQARIGATGGTAPALTFGTGDAERMRLTSTGLGVGTTSPDEKLEVAGDIKLSNTSTRIIFEDTNSPNQSINRFVSYDGALIADVDPDNNGSVSGTFRVNVDGTERLRIDSSGRVGIGTSTIGAKLQIVDTGTAQMRIGYNTSSAYANIGRTLSGIYEISSEEAGASIRFQTSDSANTPVTALTIDRNQRVGIGTTSPSTLLDVRGSTEASIRWGTTSNFYGTLYADATLTTLNSYNSNPLAFSVSTGTGYSEKARIDSSGRLLVGTSSQANAPISQNIGLASTGGVGISNLRFSNNPNPPYLQLGKSRATVINGYAVVGNNDELGRILFVGADGTDMQSQAGSIGCFVDGTPGTADMPGRLVFSTTADGASSPTERMRITSAGNVGINVTPTAKLEAKEDTSSADTVVFRIKSNWSSSNQTQMLVLSDGDVENRNNAYRAISDAKLKENIVDANSQWEDIKSLRVRNYNFIEGAGDPSKKHIGLIAQETELVSPGLVAERANQDDEGNDLGTTTKSVNYSVLYMKAVKALQEAMERIETLEAKVSALEAN